jgi:hypothetical protein
MKKKGQVPLPLIIGIAVIIIFGMAFGWWGTNEKLNTEQEKTEYWKGLNSQCQRELGEACEQIDNQEEVISDLREKINIFETQNSTDKYAILWVGPEVIISETWALIINISLSLFSISLIKIVIQFGNGKKRR